jgi:acetyltransferase
VEVIADKAVALPPLNDTLARALMIRTRVHRLLLGYRTSQRPIWECCGCVGALARMPASFRAQELDINPLLAGPRSVVALTHACARQPPASFKTAIRPCAN